MSHRYNKAVKHFQARDLKSSLMVAQKALESVKEKERIKFLNLVGIIYHELGLYNQAVKAFKESLDINDKEFQTWENLGIIYRRLNKFEAAESCFLRALQLNPSSDEVLTSLGVVYLFIDEVEKAINCFEKSIKINANWGATYGNLALAYALDNKFHDADHCLKKAITLGFPNHKVVQERIYRLKNFARYKAVKPLRKMDEGDVVLH